MPIGAAAPSRSCTLFAYCDDVRRCMCATGTSPLGVVVVVVVAPADPIELVEAPLDAPGGLPVELEPPPVDVDEPPGFAPDTALVQPKADAMTPAKAAPVRNRDDSCVTGTSVDTASSTPRASARARSRAAPLGDMSAYRWVAAGPPRDQFFASPPITLAITLFLRSGGKKVVSDRLGASVSPSSKPRTPSASGVALARKHWVEIRAGCYKAAIWLAQWLKALGV